MRKKTTRNTITNNFSVKNKDLRLYPYVYLRLYMYPVSVSGIRIRYPYPVSVSGIRIRYPYPVSVSGIRYPYPVSVSGTRVFYHAEKIARVAAAVIDI